MEIQFADVMKLPLFQDRSLMIKDFVEATNKCFVDNKPQRFGKTTNVYALVLYLSKFVELKNSKMFQELKIGKEREFEQKYFKKCQVLYLNLRVDADKNVFDTVLNAFKSCFQSLKQHFPSYNVDFDPKKMRESLTDLIRNCMAISKRFVIIDEYDSAFFELYTVFRTAKEEEDRAKAKNYAAQIYSLINAGHKDYCCRFFITGIVSIYYGGFFSDTSMVFSRGFEIYQVPWREYHLVSMEEFINSKGFETRVKPDTAEQTKLMDWYGGYTLIKGTAVIGNYLNLFSLSQYYEADEYRSYFSTGECTPWLRRFLQEEEVMLDVNKILTATDEITINLKHNPTLKPESSRDDIRSLLVKCGFLALVSKVDDKKNSERRYSVKVTNLECRIILETLVTDSFSKFLPLSPTQENRVKLYEALESGNAARLQDATDLLFAAVQGNIKYEETYGLLYYSAIQDFPGVEIMPQDTPAGAGKCDGVVWVREKAYVVEFKRSPLSKIPDRTAKNPEAYNKWCSDEAENLLRGAENQVKNQKYKNILLCKPKVAKNYLLWMAFVQKRSFVKLLEIPDE